MTLTMIRARENARARREAAKDASELEAKLITESLANKVDEIMHLLEPLEIHQQHRDIYRNPDGTEVVTGFRADIRVDHKDGWIHHVFLHVYLNFPDQIQISRMVSYAGCSGPGKESDIRIFPTGVDHRDEIVQYVADLIELKAIDEKRWGPENTMSHIPH